jgi:hypothetical protein
MTEQFETIALWLESQLQIYFHLIMIFSGVFVLLFDKRVMKALNLGREAKWAKRGGWGLIIIAIIWWSSTIIMINILGL